MRGSTVVSMMPIAVRLLSPDSVLEKWFHVNRAIVSLNSGES